MQTCLISECDKRALLLGIHEPYKRDICIVPKCGKSPVGRGYCRVHYMRWYTHGDVRADIPIKNGPTPLKERLWSFIDSSGGPNACWPWIGTKNASGYGVIKVANGTKNGKNSLAHRVVFELVSGPIPPKKDLDHTCHTPACMVPFKECPYHACCNPSHLEAVTRQENIRRGRATITVHIAIAASSSVARAKTTCKYGHPYSENLFIRWDGARGCRICQRAAAKRSYIRHGVSNQGRKNAYHRELFHNNIQYHTAKLLQVQLNSAIRHTKNTLTTKRHIITLLGCNIETLKQHLQGQFRPGMTWDNYGLWEIDHIIPCSTFDLTNKDQQCLCFHYSNLQPLWVYENRFKSNKSQYKPMSST